MAAHDHLGEMFHAQLAASQDERGFIQGQAAREIFRKANIRMWPGRDAAPHLGRSEGYIDYDNTDPYTGEPSTSDVRPSETLHTTQQHLHGPTLSSLLKNYDETRDDHPIQVYDSERGDTWIEEGHTRLVAHRLQGWTAEAQRGSEMRRARH